jgi:hypothetical protein
VATRIYASSTATPTYSPSMSATWTKADQATRHVGLPYRDGSALDNTAFVAAGSSGNDTCMRQIVIGPLAAQTLSGTWIAQARASEGTAGTDARSQARIRVMSPAGVQRGIAWAFEGTGTLSNEFATALTNHSWPLAYPGTLTNVDIQAGDYIVVELGARQHAASTQNLRCILGSPSTGTPFTSGDNSETAATGVPWIEFSMNLVFISGTGAVTTEPVAAAGTGAQTFSGTGAVTTPVVAVESDATLTLSGEGAVTLPAAAVSGEGEAGEEVTFTGSGGVSLVMASLAGEGSYTLSGTGAVTLPVVRVLGSDASTALTLIRVLTRRPYVR